VSLPGGFSRAEWRGVPFWALSAEGQSGRRVKVHVYPGGAQPFAEDLGREPERIVVEGRVVGRDVAAQLERLRLACDQPGAGTLVHPTRGALRVVAEGGLRTRVSTSEAGVGSFVIEFVEAGQEVYPLAQELADKATGTAADKLRAIASAVFVASVQVKGPEFLRASLKKGLVKSAQALTGVKLQGPSQAGSLFQAALVNFASGAETLATNPGAAALSLGEILGTLFEAAGGNVGALAALEKLASLEPNPTTGASALAQQAQKNEGAPIQLLRELALAEAARAAAGLAWESYPQAVLARDRLQARLDAAMLAAGDGSFEALRELRARLARAVPAPSQQLPQVGAYTSPLTVPAEVIAYELYGDAGRAEELVRRNRLRHPGLVPAGQPLEVLVP
jgi:prophage DNA circulation protein